MAPSLCAGGGRVAQTNNSQLQIPMKSVSASLVNSRQQVQLRSGHDQQITHCAQHSEFEVTTNDGTSFPDVRENNALASRTKCRPQYGAVKTVR